MPLNYSPNLYEALDRIRADFEVQFNQSPTPNAMSNTTTIDTSDYDPNTQVVEHNANDVPFTRGQVSAFEAKVLAFLDATQPGRLLQEFSVTIPIQAGQIRTINFVRYATTGATMRTDEHGHRCGDYDALYHAIRFCIRPSTATTLDEFILTRMADAPHGPTDKRTLAYRARLTAVRHYFTSRKATEKAIEMVSRCNWYNVTPATQHSFHGYQYFDGTDTEYAESYFRKIKARLEQAGRIITSVANGSREASDCYDDLMPIVQWFRDSSATCKITGRILKAWNDLPNVEYELIVADCGHVCLAQESYEVNGRAGDQTACDDCYQDSDVVIQDVINERGRDVGPRWREDVHYWESDDAYHTHPEPDYDYDDEDEDEDDNLLESWGSDTTHQLKHLTMDITPSSDFIMGVELEVECKGSGDRTDALHACDGYFNDGAKLPAPYAMFKRDGSLSESRGFEIVTAARTLDEHITMFTGWEPPNYIQAWNAGNCGVHVHIDSRAFSALTLGKFVTFINTDQNEGLIKRVAGRHPRTDEQARSYCRQLDQDAIDLPSKALKAGHNSRYRMVNLSNLGTVEKHRLHVEAERDSKGSYSTVEVRIFRASLKKERLLSQLEFTHAAVMFCRTASYADLTEPAFKKWLATSGRRYKSLRKWLGVVSVRSNTSPANASRAPQREVAEV